jgi:hypothetical protein
MREELSATERTLARHLARVTSTPVSVRDDARTLHGAMLANSRG